MFERSNNKFAVLVLLLVIATIKMKSEQVAERSKKLGYEDVSFSSENYNLIDWWDCEEGQNIRDSDNGKVIVKSPY